jgi:hypothetical protein
MDTITYILSSDPYTPAWGVHSPSFWAGLDDFYIYGFSVLSAAEKNRLYLEEYGHIEDGPYPTRNIGVYMAFDTDAVITIDISDQDFAGWEERHEGGVNEGELINFDDDGEAFAILLSQLMAYDENEDDEGEVELAPRAIDFNLQQEEEELDDLWEQQQKEKRWERAKKDQYNAQQTERHELLGGVHIASDANKDSYYTMLLGKDYKDIMFFDSIMQDDVKLGNYISEDPDNIVFIIDKIKLFSTSRAHVNTVLAHYECQEPDSMAEMSNEKLLSLSPLGCPCVGMVKYTAIKHIVVDSNLQIFSLRNTKKHSKTLVSHEARYIVDDYTSEAHCQTGSEKGMYQIYSPPRYI